MATIPLRALQLEITRLREENQTLKEELGLLRSSIRELRELQEIFGRMTPEMEVFSLLRDLLAAALAAVGAGDGSLLLLDEETGELVFAVVQGEAQERLQGYRLSPGEGIAGWVAANKETQIVADVHRDPHFSPRVDEAFEFHTRSLACLPLLHGERVLGVLEALNKNSDREFTDDDHDLLMLVANMAAEAIARAETMEG